MGCRLPITNLAYCPIGQGVHSSAVELITPKCPGLHRQSNTAPAAVPLVLESAGQLVQPSLPRVSLNSPSSHSVQVPLSWSPKR